MITGPLASGKKQIGAIVISTSPVSPFSRGGQLCSAFLWWLVGSDLPGTTPQGVHSVYPPDQAAFMRGLLSSATDNVVVVHRKVKTVSDAQRTRMLEDVVLFDVLAALQSAAKGELKSIKDGTYKTQSSMKVRGMEIVHWDVTRGLSKLLDDGGQDRGNRSARGDGEEIRSTSLNFWML